MTHYLKTNFEEIRYGAMSLTFDALERAFQKFNIDFYIIGAFARDLWINHIDTLPDKRRTTDIDFSIMIASQEVFEQLKEYLQVSETFTQDANEPYRLYSPDQTIVDLIPFGGIEVDHVVALRENPPMEISVFGSSQVLNHAVNIRPEIDRFKICTLPGLCILKLISGTEKPERSPKDIGDFFYILENYSHIAGDTIYELEYDDLIDDGFEANIAAAKMLGRQMSVILKDSKELSKAIERSLVKLMEGHDKESIDQMYSYDPAIPKIIRLKMVSDLLSQI